MTTPRSPAGNPSPVSSICRTPRSNATGARLVQIGSLDPKRWEPLGPGWTHSYNIRVTRNLSQGRDDIVVWEPDGGTALYILNPDGTYTPPHAVHDSLVKNADSTFTVTLVDQTTWSISTDGKLLQIADREGHESRLRYNGIDQLTSIGDPAGRGALTLEYDPKNSR